jgi:hypothetical protein
MPGWPGSTPSSRPRPSTRPDPFHPLRPGDGVNRLRASSCPPPRHPNGTRRPAWWPPDPRPRLRQLLQPSLGTARRRVPIAGVESDGGVRVARSPRQGAVEMQQVDLLGRAQQPVAAAIALLAVDQTLPAQIAQHHRQVVHRKAMAAGDDPGLQGFLSTGQLQQADQGIAESGGEHAQEPRPRADSEQRATAPPVAPLPCPCGSTSARPSDRPQIA